MKCGPSTMSDEKIRRSMELCTAIAPLARRRAVLHGNLNHEAADHEIMA